MKTTFLTVLALLAFTGNSVLCRLALGDGLIDAAGFTSIRLLAGALMLVMCLYIQSGALPTRIQLKPSWRNLIGSALLFIYAWCFSLAYLSLDTGSGALILFGFVQLTLLLSACLVEQRPTILEVLGMVLAFSGLVYWLIPAWGTPTLFGFLLMAIAGVAWGLYTLVGRKAKSAFSETTQNFIYSLLFLVALNLWVFQPEQWSGQGLTLAVLSGALTSGVGYAIWYTVLPELTSIKAAVVQLLVPVLAALGGWLFVAEAIDLRWLVAALLVLGGVLLTLFNGSLNPTVSIKK